MQIYRILTTGKQYRIQVRRFLRWKTVTETKHIGDHSFKAPLDLNSKEEAEARIRVRNGWRVIH